MNYLKMFKSLFLCSKKDFLVYAGAVLGGGVFGTILSLAIIATTDAEGYSCVGTMLGAAFGLIVLLFGNALGGQVDFQMAIAMNRARMPYLVARYLLDALQIAFSLVLCYGIKAIERMVGNRLGSFEDFFNPSLGMLAAITFGLPLVILLFAVLYTKFERKFFWVMWGIYMLACLGGPRIATAMEKHPESVAAKIGFFFRDAMNLNPLAFGICSGVLVIGLIIADVLLYKKVDIKL